MKRVFDIIIAVIVFTTLIPVILFTAFLIKIKLGSPVIFTQIRPGLNGKPFNMMKFRSMLDANDKNGKPLPDELRLTKFGQTLRATSLDELPGLINVIRGDMSLVGPRPLLMEYLPLYTAQQAKRHDVRPGITGWAQVNGRNAISWEDKFKLDVWYVENQSFFLDLKILILTILKVVKKDGISADNHVTMPKFDGTKNEK